MQETEQWMAARLGRFTSSQLGALMTGGSRYLTAEELAARPKGDTKIKVNTEFGETAMTYIKEVLKESMTGISKQGPTTWAMQWGNENEPVAARLYAEKYPDFIYYGGFNPKFFPWDEHEDMAGGSPDGERPKLVAEIKCPDTKFMDYWAISKGFIFGREDPYQGTINEWLKDYEKDYYVQIQANMIFCKKQAAHLIVFDPRMPEPEHQLVILTIQEDLEYQELIKSKVRKAIDILLHQYNILTS